MNLFGIKKAIFIFVFCVATSSLLGMHTSATTLYEENGALAVSGTKLVSQKTQKPVQLRGVSTHGINWDVGYPYISKDAFQGLRDDYGVNAVRLAMYTTEYYGYCDKGAASDSQTVVQETLKKRIDTGVQAATDLGMYVIIDWHVLSEQNPTKYQKKAVDFFKEMSKKYANHDNVIYEICNEPNGGTSWGDIKKYANAVIPVIRENDKDAVIIVGTPTWSRDVDVASKDPLKFDNIMYTLHFYAATHKDSYRDKLKTALANHLPVMVTEYGLSEASGSGAINKSEAEKWLQLLDENQIGYFAWSLSNKDESASLLKAGISKKSGFQDKDLSEAGKWVLKRYQKMAGAGVNTDQSIEKVGKVKLSNKKGKKIKVSFAKVSGADGYEVQYSTKKSFAKSKTKTTSTNAITLKKLKKGKYYYVRVRAYKYVDGVPNKGAFSLRKAIKVKK